MTVSAFDHYVSTTFACKYHPHLGLQATSDTEASSKQGTKNFLGGYPATKQLISNEDKVSLSRFVITLLQTNLLTCFHIILLSWLDKLFSLHLVPMKSKYRFSLTNNALIFKLKFKSFGAVTPK